jgi:hypothetical protein
MIVSIRGGGAEGAPCTPTIFWSIVHSQLFSIPPVGPYPIRSKISCTTEYYHGRVVPRNFYLSDYVLIQQSPHTHIRHVRLFRLGCYLKPPLHAQGSVLPRLSFWASSWYFQTSWSSPGEACLPQKLLYFQSVFWHPRVEIYRKLYYFRLHHRWNNDLMARHVSI